MLTNKLEDQKEEWDENTVAPRYRSCIIFCLTVHYNINKIIFNLFKN